MEEWKEYKLGDILTIKYGKDHKLLADGDIPIYGSGGIMRYGERSLYDGPSILIPRKGSLNNIMYSDKPFWTVDTMFWSIINNTVANPLFVYYSICKKDFASLNVGSAVPSLTVPVIEDINILLPSLAEQKQIVSILKSLDDKIEVNRRINDNLEQQAQALFKSWFVDFEPFKDGEFEESELGRIPKGWRVGTIGEICKFENGFAFKSETYVNNGDYKVITIKNVQDGYLDTNGANSVSCIPDKMPAYCNLNSGDILLSLTGNVGRCCFVTEDKLLLNQRVAKIKATINNHWGYVYTLFRTSDFKEKMIGIARGTAQANLSPVETSRLQIVIPPLNISEAFSLITNDNYQTMITKTMESRRLAELRDALLPKLMSGELKVNEVEKDIC